jgi:hypothetical protein
MVMGWSFLYHTQTDHRDPCWAGSWWGQAGKQQTCTPIEPVRFQGEPVSRPEAEITVRCLLGYLVRDMPGKDG